jgi:hypothetical protein
MRNRETNPLNLITSSLEIVSYNTTLPNYDIIRLNRMNFVITFNAKCPSILSDDGWMEITLKQNKSFFAVSPVLQGVHAFLSGSCSTSPSSIVQGVFA